VQRPIDNLWHRWQAAPLRVARWLVAVLVLCAGTASAAGDRLTELSNKLKTDKDFRVRTQAALALGVSQSDRAVPPLCSGLEDENHTVRAASAAALGKLRRGGSDCISRRLASEQHPKVKEMLAKVLKRLAQPVLPSIGPDTRYYVAIGPTTNKTPGTDGDIDTLVRDALNRELAKDKTLALAPSDETADQAEKLLAKHKGVKSVFIWPKLQASDEGGALVFKLSFTLFSYPDKAFKGSLAQGASLPGGRSSDSGALEQLMEAAAPLIVAKFVSNVGRLQ
jgi:HEAT repeat protein